MGTRRQARSQSVVAPVGERFRHLDHHVYDALLEAMIDGRLAPGTRLVLDDLADQLKVSRTPIRDALGRLSSEGLVQRIGRQGFTVVSLSRQELAELYEVRLMYELFALEIGIENTTPDILREMELVAGQGFQSLRAGDPVTASLNDGQFHRLIVSLGRNRTLSRLFEQLNIHIQTLRMRPPPEEMARRRQQYEVEHAAVIDAIRRHDLEGARQALRSHIVAARDRALVALDASFPDPDASRSA